MQPWTIRRIVAWTTQDFAERGLDSPRLDAELLVAEALGLDRVRLYMDLDRPLVEEERDRVRELVRRRRRREPVAYILGRREFYGRSFAVSPAVLIPRPDTETLVELALERLEGVQAPRLLDLCTGSGAVGLTLAAERPDGWVDLTDRCAEALSVAEQNAAQLGLSERVRLLEGDLFAPVAGAERPEPYDLIACNPPYVPAREAEGLAPDVADHEPRQALVPGPTGLELIERLAAEAGAHLRAGGVLLVEVGAGQAEAVELLLAEQPWVQSTARHRDLAGVERVLEARRGSGS